MRYSFDFGARELKSKIKDSSSANPFKVGYYRFMLGNFFYINYRVDDSGESFGCLPIMGFIRNKEGKAYINAVRCVAPFPFAVIAVYIIACIIGSLFALYIYPFDWCALFGWSALACAVCVVIETVRNYVFTLFDVGFEAYEWLCEFFDRMGGKDLDLPDDAAAETENR